MHPCTLPARFPREAPASLLRSFSQLVLPTFALEEVVTQGSFSLIPVLPGLIAGGEGALSRSLGFSSGVSCGTGASGQGMALATGVRHALSCVVVASNPGSELGRASVKVDTCLLSSLGIHWAKKEWCSMAMISPNRQRELECSVLRQGLASWTQAGHSLTPWIRFWAWQCASVAHAV